MYGYIYKTTNLRDGMMYIGMKQSSCFHPAYFGSGVRIKKALKKFGVYNFIVEVLERCETREALHEAERKWIRLYGADFSSRFYNIAEGGFNARGTAFREDMERIYVPRTSRRDRKVKRGLMRMADLAEVSKTVPVERIAQKYEVSEAAVRRQIKMDKYVDLSDLFAFPSRESE